jgi:hypothetical protein
MFKRTVCESFYLWTYSFIKEVTDKMQVSKVSTVTILNLNEGIYYRSVEV